MRPSRVKIRCKYCGKEMRKDMLARHTQSVHQYKEPSIAVENSQGTLSTFLRGKSVSESSTERNIGQSSVLGDLELSRDDMSESTVPVPSMLKTHSSTKEKDLDCEIVEDTTMLKAHKRQKTRSCSPNIDQAHDQASIADITSAHGRFEVPCTVIIPPISNASSQSFPTPTTDSCSPLSTSSSVSRQSIFSATSLPTAEDKLDKLLSMVVKLSLEQRTRSQDDLKVLGSTISVQSSRSLSTAVSSAAARSGYSEHNETNEAQQILIRSAKSLDYILNICPFLECDSERSYLKCSLCEGDKTCASTGYFTYDFSLGQNFTDSNQPKAFGNLKKKIISHIQSQTHMSSLTKKEVLSDAQEKIQSKNYKIGMNLARIIYKNVKSGFSQFQYETDVLVDSEKGVLVGELQHSRKFSASLTIDIATVLKNRLLYLMNTPLKATSRTRPFSVIGDKLTPNRRTLQIVGIVTWMNNDVDALFLDMAVVKSHSGRDLAVAILNALTEFGFTPDFIRSNLVGGGFDGQYFILKVHEKIQQSISSLGSFVEDNNVDESDNKKKNKWLLFTWDPAHRLELAEGDLHKCKKYPQLKWVDKHKSIITEVNKSCSFGKGFEHVLDAAAKTTVKSALTTLCADFRENQAVVHSTKISA